MTELEGYVCAPGDIGKIAVIVSRFNKSITDGLLQGALSKLRTHMVSDDQITVVRVPGAFEIPTLAQRFAMDPDYAAVICLGCVIKGETPHNEYINRAVSGELARIGAEFSLPVVFGLITCDTVEQAQARSGTAEICKDKTLGEQPGNKGAEAAEVALEMLDLFGKLPEIYDPEEDEEQFSSLRQNSDRYLRGDFESVDVDPDSLEDVDDEDDEEEEDPSWFLHRTSFSSAPKEKPERGPRKDVRKKEFHKKGSEQERGGKGSIKGKSKSSFHGKSDKKDKKRNRKH